LYQKQKQNIMKARTANNGKVIVKTSETLKGRGIRFRGIASNGENSFLLTQNAYEKIAHKCTYEK
jgi:phage antirepressor YoqD-like protein